MLRTFAPRGAGLAIAATIAVPLAFAAAGDAEAQSRCGASVTVSPGDTLSRIARRCDTSLSSLMRANPQISNPNLIEVGMTIRLSGRVARDESRSRRDRDGRGDYRIRRGDTLAAIARRHGIPLSLLIRLNREFDPRALRPGLVIRLPGGDGRDDRERGRRITITGRITPQGVECPVIRTDRGLLYSLAGDVGRFGPGDRVQVQGSRVDASICQQGTAIEVARIRSAERDRRSGVRVTGTITGEGTECPALRGDDGRLYTLAGDVDRFGPGDRVQVRGQRTEVSICQQGTTIEVDRIRSAG